MGHRIERITHKRRINPGGKLTHNKYHQPKLLAKKRRKIAKRSRKVNRK